jgi:thioredoxin 1
MRRFNLTIIMTLFVGLFGFLSHSDAQDPKINLQGLLSKRVPILLEFGRGWCKPCKYMKPILDEMGAAYSGKAIVATVDMDVNKDLVRDFRIRMMPTQVFIAPDGKEFFRNEGTFERDHIMQVFTKMGVAPPNMQGAAPGAPPQARQVR